MTQFNPRNLFLLIQSTAVHPANHRFQPRFEFLLGLLFSIPRQRFRQRALSNTVFCEFIRAFERDCSNLFTFLEDWVPCPQRELIPYFFEGNKYHFFYGSLERPYEFLRQFDDIFLDLDDRSSAELEWLRQLFTLSLTVQTKLLEAITRYGDFKTTTNSIHVASRKFHNEISSLFQVAKQDLQALKALTPIRFGGQSLSPEQILEKCGQGTLFSTLHVHFSDSEDYFILPQLHLEILYACANRTVRTASDSPNVRRLIDENFRARLQKECLSFFTVRRLLKSIINPDTGNDIGYPADVIAHIDTDKVVLFKAIHHSPDVDLSQNVNHTLHELHSVVQQLRTQKLVGLVHLNRAIVPAPVRETEFWQVVVYEATTLNCMISIQSDTPIENVWVVNMMDLRAIFELVPSNLSLVKFLKSDRELLQRTQVFCADYLDRFAAYINGGESYMRAGKYPDYIHFGPHDWSSFYHKRLFERHQDDIYELIELEFPKTFNEVRKSRDNIYQVVDKGRLNGGWAVKYGKRLVWVIYPSDGYNCTDEEIRVYASFLGPLYADYLDRLREQIGNIFRKHGADPNEGFRVAIYPASLVARDSRYTFLRESAAGLSQDNPIVVLTDRIASSGSIRSCVVYRNEYLPGLFAPLANVGERHCVFKLVESLIAFLDPKASRERVKIIAEKFVARHIPVETKGYSLDLVSTENPKLRYYGSPHSICTHSISKVNREIAEYLASSGERPGEYKGDEAKRLCNRMFLFIRKQLENELREYSEDVLLYGYTQAELIEGRRATTRLQLGLEASKRSECDLVKKQVKLGHETSDLANSAKYLLQTALKVGLKGKRTVTQERWNYLQALAYIAQETAIMSDYIHYDIAPHRFRINELCEFQDIRGEQAFDIEKFHQVEGELRVAIAKEHFQKHLRGLSEPVRKSSSNGSDESTSFDGINTAFKAECGFTFGDLVRVLFALGMTDRTDERSFPLTIISQDELLALLSRAIQKNIDKCELERILEFVTVGFGTYAPDEDLIPTQQFRRRERITLCPVVRLKSGKCVFGSQMCLSAAQMWINHVTTADLPYSVNEGGPIAMALAELHRNLDKELEQQAESIARTALGSDCVEANIENFKRLSVSFAARPGCGEIDILAVNKRAKIVFVLDAKNVNRKILPSDIRREMRRFFDGKKSYFEHLAEKEHFVRGNLLEVLRHFDVHDPIGAWRVRKAFVVSTNYPSAYRPGQTVDFVFLDNLATYLVPLTGGSKG